MRELEIIEHHLLIRNTIGSDILDNIDIFDMPKIMEFLKIVSNYCKLKDNYI